MEDTKHIYLQQQVNELSQKLQLLERQISDVLAAQTEFQSHLELLNQQSLQLKEQEIRAKRARIALPQLP